MTCEGLEIVGCGNFKKLYPDIPCSIRIDYPCFGNGYPTLHNNLLRQRFKSFFNRYLIHINTSFRALDPMDYGKIKVDDLRKILERYCFPFTEEQWNEIMYDFNFPNNMINYHMFRDCYRKNCNPRIERRFQNLGKVIFSKQTPRVPRMHRPMVHSIKKTVLSNKEGYLLDFKHSDVYKLGTVSKKECKRILEKNVFPLKVMQFENIYLQLPLNKRGELIYEDFIKEFSWMEPPYWVDPPPPQALLCQDANLKTLAPCPVKVYQKILTYKRPLDCKDVLCGCGKACPVNHFAPGVCPEGKPPCAYDTCYKLHRKPYYV